MNALTTYVKEGSGYDHLINHTISIKYNTHLAEIELFDGSGKSIGCMVTHPNRVFNGNVERNILMQADAISKP